MITTDFVIFPNFQGWNVTDYPFFLLIPFKEDKDFRATVYCYRETS